MSVYAQTQTPKSITVPIHWLPFNWSEVAYFTEIKGSFWISVHAFRPIEIHSVLLKNGRVWDAINGYRSTRWID